MSIKQVRDGIYQIDICPDQDESRRIRKRVKCASELDALAIEADLRRKLDIPFKITPNTVNKIAQQYIPTVDTPKSRRHDLPR